MAAHTISLACLLLKVFDIVFSAAGTLFPSLFRSARPAEHAFGISRVPRYCSPICRLPEGYPDVAGCPHGTFVLAEWVPNLSLKSRLGESSSGRSLNSIALT